jgi:hypothetical protein
VKQFALEIPDAIYDHEPVMWDKFAVAMQMAFNRMAVGYMKYHADKNELFMEATEIDDVAFIRQRLAMYSGCVGIDLCDCGMRDDLTIFNHSPSCFIRMHAKKIDTGNTENLLDVANGAFCEFIRPNRRGAFFRSQTSEDSPGLTRS